MDKQLKGRVSIVTGAARGIGRAIAEALAREGSDLALCDVKEEWLAETVEAVTKLGRKAKTYATAPIVMPSTGAVGWSTSMIPPAS